MTFLNSKFFFVLFFVFIFFVSVFVYVFVLFCFVFVFVFVFVFFFFVFFFVVVFFIIIIFLFFIFFFSVGTWYLALKDKDYYFREDNIIFFFLLSKTINCYWIATKLQIKKKRSHAMPLGKFQWKEERGQVWEINVKDRGKIGNKENNVIVPN